MLQFKVPLPQFGTGSAIVQVRVISPFGGSVKWFVDWVDEMPTKGKRKPHFPPSNTHEAIVYRGERLEKYEQDFFRSLLGEEVYKDVLRQAWMMAMPDELKEE